MTNNSGIACTTKAAAVASLQIIAGTFSRGTPRDALIAVIAWIEANMAPDFTPETAERIQKIYNEAFDDAARKGFAWHMEGGEPQSGARVEVPFIYDAEAKAWKLEGEMPPTWKEPAADFLPKSDAKFSDNDEENL